MIRHRMMLTLLAALAVPSLALAQQAVTPPDQPLPDAQARAVTGMSGVECEGEFIALYANGDGFISQKESLRDTARASIDVDPQGLTGEQFMDLCASGTWAQAAPPAGAPLEGTNSFTEEQARERAAAWNVAEVSALALDSQGIWRGTGRMGANPVAVAVDYQGNVVTTPATE